MVNQVIILARKLIVVGLGIGGVRDLPVNSIELLQNSRSVFVQSGGHPVIRQIGRKCFHSFQHLIEEENSFQNELKIISEVVREASKKTVVYALPGNPFEDGYLAGSLKLKLQREGIELSCYPAQSITGACFELLDIEPESTPVAISACKLALKDILLERPYLITGLEWKGSFNVVLNMFERAGYSIEHSVFYLFFPKGEDRLQIKHNKLKDLETFNDDVFVAGLYIPPASGFAVSGYAFERLVRIMAKLRSERGCAWDRRQNHQSLKKYLVEETFEVVDAIEKEDMNNLREELGDLLLQIIFHARLAEEAEIFNISDVLEAINAKLIRRHPHVFGKEKTEDVAQVERNWEKIKSQEKKLKASSIFESIPRSLPGLVRAQKIQECAARVGFDWTEVSGAWAKLKEELLELRKSIQESDEKAREEELGDLLFAAVNVARFLNIEAEEALNKTINKFMVRFKYIEEQAKESQKELNNMSLEEMNLYWERAKK